MKCEGKICRKSELKAQCSDMTIKEAENEFRICLDLSNTIKKAMRGPKHPIHIFGVTFHVQCYITFDVNKPRKFGHCLNYPRPEFWLRHFVKNNFHCQAFFMLETDFFSFYYVSLFLRRVDILLPLKQIRRMQEEAFWHKIIKQIVRAQ